MTISAADKQACAKREVAKRRQVYPRLIAAARLSAEKAAREIAIMEAIEQDYERETQKERLL